MAGCPVCGNQATIHPTQGDRKEYTCDTCGQFEITGTAEAVLANNIAWTAMKRSALSHRIRLDQNLDARPRIDTYLMERVAQGAIRLPTPPQQATNLLRYVGERVSESGEPIRGWDSTIHALVGAPNSRAAVELLFELEQQGLVKGSLGRTISGPPSIFDLEPTLTGWNALEREVKDNGTGRVAIIAMKFGDPELDAFVDGVVKAAVVQAGYLLERVSDRPRAGVIDQIMRLKIRDAPFLLADLSHDNNGAYWEAGFAEGLGKPVIYLCHAEKWAEARSHFDTSHCETIDWHADKAEVFRERLVAIIRNSMAGR